MSVFHLEISRNLINKLIQQNSGITFVCGDFAKEISFAFLEKYEGKEHDIGTFVASDTTNTILTNWHETNLQNIDLVGKHRSGNFTYEVMQNGPLYNVTIDWYQLADPPIVSCKCVDVIRSAGSGLKQIEFLQTFNQTCEVHKKWSVFKNIIKSISSDSYKVDSLKNMVFTNIFANDVVELMTLINGDSYKVDALKHFTLPKDFAPNIICKINGDTYKIDALRHIGFDSKDLPKILGVIMSDSYRVDAIKIYTGYSKHLLPSIIKCIDSDSYKMKVVDYIGFNVADLVEIVKLFDDDSRKTKILEKGGYNCTISICLTFQTPAGRLGCLKKIIGAGHIPSQEMAIEYISYVTDKDDYGETLELLLSRLPKECHWEHIKLVNKMPLMMKLIEKFNIKMGFDEAFELSEEKKDIGFLALVNECTEAQYDKLLMFYLETPTLGGAKQLLRLCSVLDKDQKISFGQFTTLLINEETMVDMIGILIAFKKRVSSVSHSSIEALIKNNYYRNQLAEAFGLKKIYGLTDGSGLKPPFVIYKKDKNPNMCLMMINGFGLSQNDVMEYRRYMSDNKLQIRRGYGSLSVNGFSTQQEEMTDAIAFFKNPPKGVEFEYVDNTYSGFNAISIGSFIN